MTDTITLIPAQFAELRDRARRAVHDFDTYASTLECEAEDEQRYGWHAIGKAKKRYAKKLREQAAYWRQISEGRLP